MLEEVPEEVLLRKHGHTRVGADLRARNFKGTPYFSWEARFIKGTLSLFWLILIIFGTLKSVPTVDKYCLPKCDFETFLKT